MRADGARHALRGRERLMTEQVARQVIARSGQCVGTLARVLLES